MSYLMDALRKAERERNIGRVPDAVTNEYATAYIPARKRLHWLPVLLGGLILLNLVMLTAFWFGSRGGGSAQPVSTPPPASPPAAAAPSASSPATEESAAAPVAPAQPAAQMPRAVQPADKTLPSRPPESAATEAPRPESAAPAVVEESPQPVQPFETDDFMEEPVPAYTGLDARQKSRIPAQSVNGHLYSSIPGRSFVLLNGKRYGEGQRTAEGPAVVYIDEEGAVLDFQGLRYRIDAPR